MECLTSDCFNKAFDRIDQSILADERHMTHISKLQLIAVIALIILSFIAVIVTYYG